MFGCLFVSHFSCNHPNPKSILSLGPFLTNYLSLIQQAFIDVDKDLTGRETPMDRLICGDVGFGKTEVALRAIFCVVSAGKQAMVLAPTIVLAKQHFDVISERFSIYPNIKVGLLSRFQVLPQLLHILGIFYLYIQEFATCTENKDES